jgi:hypothetical protein
MRTCQNFLRIRKSTSNAVSGHNERAFQRSHPAKPVLMTPPLRGQAVRTHRATRGIAEDLARCCPMPNGRLRQNERAALRSSRVDRVEDGISGKPVRAPLASTNHSRELSEVLDFDRHQRQLTALHDYQRVAGRGESQFVDRTVGEAGGEHCAAGVQG